MSGFDLSTKICICDGRKERHGLGRHNDGMNDFFVTFVQLSRFLLCKDWGCKDWGGCFCCLSRSCGTRGIVGKMS